MPCVAGRVWIGGAGMVGFQCQVWSACVRVALNKQFLGELNADVSLCKIRRTSALSSAQYMCVISTATNSF
jgi:hypothetical protein